MDFATTLATTALDSAPPNPLLDELQRPAEELMQAEADKLAAWRSSSLEDIEAKALDFDNFEPGKPEEVRRRALIGAYLDSQFDLSPANSTQHDLMRDRAAVELFGEDATGSDDVFFAALKTKAQDRKDHRDMMVGGGKDDPFTSLYGRVREAALEGKGWERAFLDWRDVAFSDPRFKKERSGTYQEAAERMFTEVSERLDAARPFAEQALGELKAERDRGTRSVANVGTAVDAIMSAPPAQRQDVVALLMLEAQKEGASKEAGGHHLQTFGRALARQLIVGPSSTAAARDITQAEEFLSKIKPGDEFGGMYRTLVEAAAGNVSDSSEGALLGVILEPFVTNQVATAESIAEAKAQVQQAKERFQLAKTVEQIAAGDLDPLKPGGSWFAQKISYPFMESVAPSIASVLISKNAFGSGIGAVVPMWGMMADDNAQQLMQQNPGMDFAQAYSIGQHAAIYQSGLEYAETALSLGSTKLLGNALATARASAWKTAGRAGIANFAGEYAIEAVQPLIPGIVQELTPQAPDAPWQQIFSGYWTERNDTFFMLLPTIVMAGGGAAIQAKASLPELERLAAATHDAALMKAAGVRPETITGTTPQERLDQFGAALKNPDAALAAEGQREIDQRMREQEAAAAEAQKSGLWPTFHHTAEGWSVRDGETGKEIGTAPTPQEALGLASAHSTAVDQENADLVAYLASTMEGIEQMADGGTTTFRPGERVTETQQAAVSDADFETVMAQSAARDVLEGAPGVARVVLGRNSTEFREGSREVAIELNAGASLPTVFHEHTEAKLKAAWETGVITREETEQVVRAANQVFAGQTTKDGQPLMVLPDGPVTDTQLREAVSDLAEMELFRTRSGGKDGAGKATAAGVSSGLLSKNITAFARLAPGATKKFTRFIGALRDFWGVTLKRVAVMKKAIKEGKIDENQLSGFLEKLYGLKEQDLHNGKAATIAEEITGEPAASFSLGPAKMADVLGNKAAKKATAPKAKAQIFQAIADRMAKLRQLIERTGNAYNFDAFGKPYEGEAKFSQEKKDTLNALALLDGILMAMPPDLRGRVGGFVQLAKLDTQEKRLDYLKRRLGTVERVVDDYLKREYTRLLDKLFDRAKPAKDEAGKKRVGKAGADVHDLFDVLRQAREWNATAVAAHLAKIDAELNDPSNPPTPEREAHLTMESALVSLVGDWRNADPARRAAAVKEATEAFERGYATFKLAKLMAKEDREIRRKALAADTGKQGTPGERDEKAVKENGLKAGWKNTILSLSSFEQVTNYIFGRDSAESKRIVDMEREASSRKEDAIQGAMDGLDDLFTRIAGGRLAGEKLRYDLSQKSLKIGERLLSPLEAITTTLMWRQEDGRRHMLGKQDDSGNYVGPWHYDQKFVDEIESKLSAEAKAVRAYIADAYSKEYDRLNPIYKELNGVNLPKNDQYSPLTVKPQQAQGGQMVDPVSGFAMSGASPTPGALRTRGSSIAEPDFRDALQTFIAHTKQMEHWMAYAPFSMEAGAILRNRELGNAIESKAGEQGLSVLRAWLDFFQQGGTRDASAHLEMNRRLNRMTNRAAGAALVGRIGVLAVQSTQLGAALAEMPTGSYLKRMGQLFSGNLGWGAAFKSDYIQRRLKQMPPVVQQAMEGLKASKPNLIKHAMQRVGQLISGTDALMTAGTYAIVYDYQLSQAKEMGLSGLEAEAWASQAAERSVDRVAQPTRGGARSLYENTSTNPMVRVSWAFASEARQKLMLAAWAVAKGTLGEKIRTLAVTYLIGGLGASMIRAAWRDARNDDDEEWFDEKNWDAKRLALSALTGPFGGIPVLGDLIEGGTFAAAGEYLPESNLLGGASPIRSLRAAMRNDWSDDKPEQILKTVEVGLSFFGLFNDTISASASLSHLVRDLVGVAENVEGED